MAKEKGTEVALSEEEKEEITPESSEEKKQTPTAEEQLKALQNQVQALTTEKERFEGGYKGLQKTLSERDRDLKKLGDFDSRLIGLQDTIELLTTAIVTKGEVDNLEPSERQDVLLQIKKKKDEAEAKRKQAEAEDTQKEYIQKADALYARAKVVFTDDDSLERIEDLLINRMLERAEARIVKAEEKGKLPPKGKENMETEEQRVDRLAQERLNKLLEERGLLEEHVSSPSASGSVQEAMRRYIAGEITADDAKKRGVDFS